MIPFHPADRDTHDSVPPCRSGDANRDTQHLAPVFSHTCGVTTVVQFKDADRDTQDSVPPCRSGDANRDTQHLAPVFSHTCGVTTVVQFNVYEWPGLAILQAKQNVGCPDLSGNRRDRGCPNLSARCKASRIMGVPIFPNLSARVRKVEQVLAWFGMGKIPGFSGFVAGCHLGCSNS